jgi:hypothetical protein
MNLILIIRNWRTFCKFSVKTCAAIEKELKRKRKRNKHGILKEGYKDWTPDDTFFNFAAKFTWANAYESTKYIQINDLNRQKNRQSARNLKSYLINVKLY